MASDIPARIITAMIISRKVKPARLDLSAGAINIKCDAPFLIDAIARPLRGQGDEANADQLGAVLFRHLGGGGLLQELHRSVTGVDLELLRHFRRARRRL